MTENDHTESVRRLFDAKADGWSAKYKPSSRPGAAPALAWRIDVFTRAVADRCPAPARVLDFGCGTGDLARAFAERGYEVTACDLSEPMLARAHAAFGDAVRWVALDAASPRLPFADGELDAVVASSVLEYVADPNAVLYECARILRPSGLLVASVPQVRHPVRRLEAVASAFVRLNNWLAGSRSRRWLARVSPRAVNYAEYLRLSKNRYSCEDWVASAEHQGFEPVFSERGAKGASLEVLGFRRRRR
ncbi:MAG: class I SAM-dependent methyltransferase [Myxococcota bacterium]|nr:class I SAM-dependent methyltransferase [Myxococcota bacterium]